MALTAAFRLYQGGDGAWTGVAVILATGTLGVAWRHYRRRPLVEISGRELYLFGLVIHLVMLALMLTLPWATALRVLASIALPVLVIYPLGVTALGVLIINRLRRERTSAALQESEATYRRIVQTANEGMWAMDGSFRTTFVNQRMADLLGYTPEEILGQPVDTFMFAEDLADHAARMAERQQGAPGVYERRFRGKDGLPRWLLVSATALQDADGRFAGSFGMFTDVAERKQTEVALHESEQRMREIVNNAPFGAHLYELGPEQRLVFVGANRAADSILGVNNQQFVGKTIEEAFPPLSQTDIPDAYRRVAATGEQYDVDQVDYADDGGIRGVFEVRAFQTGPNRMATFFRDITERKRAEQRAFELALERERMALLSKFILDVSHEFRTPLAIMQTNVYLLGRLEDPTKRQRKLAQIGDQVTGITRLVELLVEMARLDSGVPFTTQPADLNGLIGAVAAKLQGAIVAKGLTLHLELASDLLPVPADGNRLDRALRELLDNAVRYTPAGGSVTVRSASDADGVTVEVQDTGPGIPPDVLPHIFERFYRQDVTHTTPGFGLGLPIARAIVERHGGRLEAASQPGVGSTFLVTLPAVVAQQGHGRAGHRATADLPVGVETILLVEDNATTRGAVLDATG